MYSSVPERNPLTLSFTMERAVSMMTGTVAVWGLARRRRQTS